MLDCKQLTGIFFSGKYVRFRYCLCAKFGDYFDFLPYIFNFPIPVFFIDIPSIHTVHTVLRFIFYS